MSKKTYSDKLKPLTPGTENDYYVVVSSKEIKIKEGVWTRVERAETGGCVLRLALPRDFTIGSTNPDDDGGVVGPICKCTEGNSGSCQITYSQGGPAFCGGADCCDWYEPEIQQPDPPPAPDP